MSVARGMTNNNWGDFLYVSSDSAVYYGSNIAATIDYEEKVTRKWNNDYVNSFSSSLE